MSPEKETNQKIADENAILFSKGFYTLSNGTQIDFQKDLQFSISQTKVYTENDFEKLLKLPPTNHFQSTQIEVKNESTFQAAKRLLDLYRDRVVVLNFASATNPGGGYLRGARAQEEHLCRCSGLYPTLRPQIEFYEFHRKQNSFLYSDKMIFSPDVPIFRNDIYQLLTSYYKVSVVSAAAPALIDVPVEDKISLKQAENAMDSRIQKLLLLLSTLGFTNIVLGAWGCGAFRNDPQVIAGLFKKHLFENPMFTDAFSHIVFAILDPKGEGNLEIFQSILEKKSLFGN